MAYEVSDDCCKAVAKGPPSGTTKVSVFAWLLWICMASLGFSGVVHATDGEPCPGMPTMTDSEGTQYPTVRIGSQCWMREDLRTGHFRSGHKIKPLDINGPNDGVNTWSNLTEPRRAFVYIKDFHLKNVVLYNYFAVRDTRRLCPAGWNVPTRRDWDKLIAHLDGQNIAGKRMKSSETRSGSTFGWEPPNNATNDSGFSGLPFGVRRKTGQFLGKHIWGAWWIDSGNFQDPGGVVLQAGLDEVGAQPAPPQTGLAVRCLRIEPVAAPLPACPVVNTEQVEQVDIRSARIRGNVVSDGGAAVTARGVVYGTSPLPTLSDTSSSVPGGLGQFVSDLLGLSPATTYYARAYATNSAGTCYGQPLPVTTLAPPAACPVVTTVGVQTVGDSWVIIKGRVDSDGGAPVTARGVVWGTSSTPVLGPNSTNAGPGVGEFTTQSQGLSPVTPYYVRAYATNSAGTCYGATLSFSTLPPPAACPTVNTGSVLEIVLGRARIGGTVVADNGAPVTARGVAYGTSPNPTIEAAAFTMAGAGVGAFESNVLGLSPATTYHARAYATNSSGSCYGESRQFSTPAPQACPANPTVTDASANVYDTVQIGLQCWMKQNLRTAKYRNQDPVGQVTAGSNIYANAPAAGTAAWVAVDDPNWNEQAFGKLYTHGAVADARGLCPAGWRVPTENDWNILVSYLDPAANLNAPVDFAGWQLLSSTAGGALKSTAMFPTPLFGWPMPNAGATDSSGFGGLPAGWAAHGGQYVGGGAGWWTADTAAGDKAWYRTAQRDSGAVQRRSDLRKYGQSVRCIKN